jgi:NAD(P)-dependent dehydrogenase (short-subunit alcohol dehydrogenase family)
MNINGNSVVMITGASAGIGRATAQAFARRGARIGLLARGSDGLEAAKREVEELGGRGLILIADVADEKAVEVAAGKLEDKFGPIDIWINNAMASVFSPVSKMKPAEYRRVTEVTYLGYVWGTLAALRRMRTRNCGVIVQVSSALAYRGIPLQSAYCAAKHAIHGFTNSLRCELIHDKKRIRVSLVEMPAVNTPQFGWVKSRLPNRTQPVPPIYQPEVAAEGIILAIEKERREVYVGMPSVKAVVGNKIALGLLDHYLGRNGYNSQQTKEPEDPDRPDNLFRPVSGDPGTHGAFDGVARKFSLQMWINANRKDLAGAVLIPAVIIAGLFAWSKSRRRL